MQLLAVQVIDEPAHVGFWHKADTIQTRRNVCL